MTMPSQKKNNIHTTVYKRQHRELKSEQHELHQTPGVIWGAWDWMKCQHSCSWLEVQSFPLTYRYWLIVTTTASVKLHVYFNELFIDQFNAYKSKFILAIILPVIKTKPGCYLILAMYLFKKAYRYYIII